MNLPTGKLKFAYETIRNMERKINELKEKLAEHKEINRDMHVTVSGYLKGDEWDHWQEHNKSKFEL